MQPKLEQECLHQGRPGLLGSTVKCVKVVELSKISYLKVPAVEEQCFVLFCFNHQRSTVPSSSVTSLTLQVHSLQICCHQFSCPLSTHCSCSVHPCHKSQTSLFLCSVLVKIYQFTWPDLQTYTALQRPSVRRDVSAANLICLL